VTFQLIAQERAHHAVSRLCSVLNVSRQGYWAWEDSDRTYGAPRLQAELRLAPDSGWGRSAWPG
jgi:hypothetical protein